ncbi:MULTISPECIES: class I SAM-dependent methyltransferase [Crateriforma]|uniref:Magnesium-protoporphyrin O-methyltransferase n=1 Tax=Crateriforma conspicua TaxID=2527996 RepID=A0A5C6FPG7_9PLAN|nr:MULTISPECIES: class I SAM-dependent methyltransferase [Crateriforma]TWU62406.1 Magnesium-protoporphyrin O-methyltransferase [Crateriforma conspicua]
MTDLKQPPPDPTPPQWRRPRGVAPGTWQYLHQRTIADHYDAFVADTPLCHLDDEFLAELFPRRETAGCRIADLGCGTGRSAIPLARRGYDVVAIDLSRPMLQNLMRRVAQEIPTDSQPDLPIGRIDPVQANLVEMGALADDSVDHTICMFSTLGMIQGHANRNAVLKHARRMTRDGGRLVVHVHHRAAWFAEPGGMRRWLASAVKSWTRKDLEFGDHVYAYRGLSQMFLHRFSQTEITAAVHQAGWTVDQVHRIAADGTGFLSRRPRLPSKIGGFIVVAR